MSDSRRILGIDPGSRKTGFGIVDCVDGTPGYVTSGIVKTADGSFPDRLKQIYESVREIVIEYKPEVIAIESVFMHRNAGSALKLGQARSAALCATFEVEADVHEYAPREIKLAIVGTGSASKEQVQHMVVHLLRLDGVPAEDAADALAAALCHSHQRRTRSSMAGGLPIASLR